MNPRRVASVICLASLAMLLSLLVLSPASASRPDHAPYGPINGEGPWLENPGGGTGGGDGGDADELLLDEPLDSRPQIGANDGRNLSGEQFSSHLLRLKIWWLSFLCWSGILG